MLAFLWCCHLFAYVCSLIAEKPDFNYRLNSSESDVGSRSRDFMELTTSNPSKRTDISRELCTEPQINIILETLREVALWSKLCIDIITQDPPDSQNELYLRNMFGEIISTQTRELIVSRYRNIVTEVNRGQYGRILLACTTDLWEECWAESTTVVTHREANMLLLVCLSY